MNLHRLIGYFVLLGVDFFAAAPLRAQSYPDQGAAYAACTAWAASYVAQDTVRRRNPSCRQGQGGALNYGAWLENRACSTCSWNAAGSFGSVFAWPAGQMCSARATQTGWKSQGGGGSQVCHEGCAYSSALQAGTPNGYAFDPTGAVCKSDELPAPEAEPGDGDGGGDGEIPGDGDGGGDDGGGGDNGGNPGGGDGGSGGDGDGDGDGDSDDGDGDGDGGGGTLPGDGGNDGDGDTDGPGEGTGRLYKKKTRTLADVINKHNSRMQNAPIISKVKGFFGTCPGGGSCPGETWDGGQYAGKHDLTSLCSGPLLALFQFAGFVFLAAMGTVAVRWALL